jgi:hypothetical protein
MPLFSVLVISLVSILAFSMSRENGENTKYAQKNANDKVQKKVSSSPHNTREEVQINLATIRS